MEIQKIILGKQQALQQEKQQLLLLLHVSSLTCLLPLQLDGYYEFIKSSDHFYCQDIWLVQARPSKNTLLLGSDHGAALTIIQEHNTTSASDCPLQLSLKACLLEHICIPPNLDQSNGSKN